MKMKCPLQPATKVVGFLKKSKIISFYLFGLHYLSVGLVAQPGNLFFEKEKL